MVQIQQWINLISKRGKNKMLELFIKRVENQRKIALVEDGKIIEYYEEGDNDNKNEGNIYIGVVKDIVKGMQAAFVDIGTEKNSWFI